MTKQKNRIILLVLIAVLGTSIEYAQPDTGLEPRQLIKSAEVTLENYRPESG